MPTTRTVELPMQTRVATIGTVNVEERTVELVWSTGAQVRRYDWWEDRAYIEELSLDAEHVDLTRLNGGAPLLNCHSTYDLNDVLGVAEKAWLVPGEGRALVRFSKRAGVKDIFADVVDKIIRNVSVGYNVGTYEITKREGELPIYRAVKWEPWEISLVPIGADAGAGVRSGISKKPCEMIESADPAITRKEPAMDENKPAPAGQQTAAEIEAAAERTRAAAAAKAVTDKAIADAAVAADRQRGVDIRGAVRAAKLPETYADELLAGSGSVDQARAAVLTRLAQQSESNPTRGAANHDQLAEGETIKRRELMSDALLHRANPRNKLSPEARHYRGMDLMDMARECITIAGGDVRGLSRREVAALSLGLEVRGGMHSTSDFPNILGNTVNRTLRQAYQLAPKTFVGWARPSTAPDFRQVARTQLSEMSKFLPVNEAGEYKALSMGDSAEKYSLGKYGGIIALTWETLVNDDLSAFDRIPLALAEESAALEGDIVYGILSTNANMSDGVPLFHATHNNLAGAGTAISDVTLGAGRAAMRKQIGPKGRILNLEPHFLIVGPDKESEANKYTSAQFVAAKATDINPNFNTSLEVVVDGRIPGNTWYLSTTPTRVDTIEYAYLEGEDGIFTEQRIGFEVDGLQIKARHVFAAKSIDWRGLYKNPGA